VKRGLVPLLLLAASCAETEPDAPQSSSAASPVPITFTDLTDASGLDFVHDAGRSPEKQLPETMGAGAVLADLDGDGWLDLYLVQSGPLPLGASRADAPPNELWLGDGQGGFRDATADCGDAAHRGYGMGVACGDADGDGDLDLYVTNLGPDVFLRNEGGGRFRDATAEAGLGDPRWTAGAAFFDADADGDLDLYVTAYLEVDLSAPEFCGEREPGWRSYCHPDRYPGLQDRFWRNQGDGRFVDATVEAGLADSAGKGLGAAASDLDDDGDLDLYVANDSVENRLWFNDGAGNFEDGTLLSGTGVSGQGMTEAGMGITAADLDGDGRTDLYVTNFDDESNTLYRNDGDGLFTDVTARSGLEAPSRLPVGFGVVAEDFDGDGDLDLAVANGHIIDNIELYNDGKRWAQRAILLENRGAGRFEDASASAGDLCATPRVGRGLYAGDLDGDGDADLVLTENGGRARVLRNDAGGCEWIELQGLPPGTRVRFHLADGRTLVRDAGPHISYFGAASCEVRCPARGLVGIEARPPGGSWARLATSEGAPSIEPGRYRAESRGESLRLERLP